jgi:hypothetical protein
MSRETTREPRA